MRWIFERPTFETLLGNVAIWRRVDHPIDSGRNTVSVTGIDLRKWIYGDGAGSAVTIRATVSVRQTPINPTL